MRLSHRFYKGSGSLAKYVTGSGNYRVDRSILRASVEEAVEDAKKALEADRSMQCAFVVQIIKVVERDRPPFVVRDVEGCDKVTDGYAVSPDEDE